MIAKTKTGKDPMTLEDAKAHLRLDEEFTRDDTQIRSIIKGATSIAEDEIQKDIIKTTNVLTRIEYCGSTVRVNEGNFLSMTTIEADGVAVANYNVFIYKDYFVVEFDDYISTATSLVLTFITGFEDGAVPFWAERAIYIKIGDLYDVDRSSSTFANVKDTQAFERILAPHKASYVISAREN